MERGRVYRVFFLISCIAANIIAGCAPPVGSIGGSGGGAGDVFWIVPKRVLYNTGDVFRSNSDLEVFTSYRGVVESIPLDKVTIGIEDPAGQPPTPINSDGNYGLYEPGRKRVVVEYDTMHDRYSIEVQGTGSGNGDEPPPGGVDIGGIVPDWPH